MASNVDIRIVRVADQPALMMRGVTARARQAQLFLLRPGRGYLHKSGAWHPEREAVSSDVHFAESSAIFLLPVGVEAHLAVGARLTAEVPALSIAADFTCRSKTSWDRISLDAKPSLAGRIKPQPSPARPSDPIRTKASATSGPDEMAGAVPRVRRRWPIFVTLLIAFAAAAALFFADPRLRAMLESVVTNAVQAYEALWPQQQASLRLKSCESALSDGARSQTSAIKRQNAGLAFEEAKVRFKLHLETTSGRSSAERQRNEERRQAALDLFTEAVCWWREEYATRAADYFANGEGSADPQAASIARDFRSRR